LVEAIALGRDLVLEIVVVEVVAGIVVEIAHSAASSVAAASGAASSTADVSAAGSSAAGASAAASAAGASAAAARAGCCTTFFAFGVFGLGFTAASLPTAVLYAAHTPVISSSLPTSSVGCAPTRSQCSARSESIDTTDGSSRGAYWPSTSMKRPSR